ncbi:MAG: alginate lyase family protein [Opitutaceae bacterium]|jgi:hypothetical protein|nr:alginate lyase family protein [Opitutaceae bacterium]
MTPGALHLSGKFHPWVLAALIAFAPAPPAPAGETLFVDDFGGVPGAPSPGKWTAAEGIAPVPGAPPEVFGDGNTVLKISGANNKLISLPIAFAGAVSTVSFDYYEAAGEHHSVKAGIVAGGGGDLTGGDAFLRFEMKSGRLLPVATDSVEMREDDAALYHRDELFKIVIVVNDTDEVVPRYAGSRNLQPRAAEVWISRKHQLLLVGTFSFSGSSKRPGALGFRTWNADTKAEAFIDNVRVEAGAFMPGWIENVPAVTMTSRHPGMFMSQAQLDLMWLRVNHEPGHPAGLGWSRLLQDARAGLDYEPRPLGYVEFETSGTTESEDRLRNDAQAAYAHALAWVVTGDDAHCDKAIAILDGWSATLASVGPANLPAQIQLECAWIIPPFAAAAEIIRHFDGGRAGWPRENMRRFTEMLEFFCDKAFRCARWNHNQGVSGALALLATAVFEDDPKLFALGVALWKERLADILPKDLSQAAEITRDNFHVQYSLMGLIHGAEIAWQQGVDLYGIRLDNETVPRLALGLEYFSGLFLGEIPSPALPGGATYVNAARNFSAYEMALNHYTNRNPQPVGALARFVETRLRPDGVESHFVGWSTLTHARLDTDLPEAVTFQSHPQSQAVNEGGDATFSVTVTGRPAPAYQWRLNDRDILGATDSVYAIRNARPHSAGDYTVVVSNLISSATSNAAGLTVVSQGNGASGGGGGGGAAGLWFYIPVALLLAARHVAACCRATRSRPCAAPRTDSKGGI